MAQLNSIRSGLESVPDYAVDGACSLLAAIECERLGIKTSDWISWRIQDKAFIDDIVSHLRLFYDHSQYLEVLQCIRGGHVFHLIPGFVSRELFDHHCWNDCDPYWSSNPLSGRYGKTPGEDILIKLLANEIRLVAKSSTLWM